MARLVPSLPTDEGFRQMGELSARMFASPEAREGMTAFAEKRDPSWAIESAPASRRPSVPVFQSFSSAVHV